MPYPLHAFLGGNSGIEFMDQKSIFLPQQDLLFLYMSIIINLYILYTNYEVIQVNLGQDYLGSSYYEFFLNWKSQGRFVFIFYLVHLGISCLLCVRDILNSRAADEIEPLEIPGKHSFRLVAGHKSLFLSLFIYIYILYYILICLV